MILLHIWMKLSNRSGSQLLSIMKFGMFLRDRNFQVLMTAKSKKGKSALPTVAVAPQFMLSVVGRDIQVSGVSELAPSYTVFDMQGHVLRKGDVHSSSFTIPMGNAGNYLVRIGSRVRCVSVK